MSIGYMGYVKLNGTMVLATNSSVNEVLAPIYSNSVHGAGWIDAGTAYYSDDIIRYEGNIDFELVTEAMSFLTSWTTTARNASKTVVVSPDGSVIYTFTAGLLTGAWNSSANFSTSEGSMITCSCGVMGLGRTEAVGTSYTVNSAGLNEYPDYHPYPYWKSSVDVLAGPGGTNPFGVGSVAIDWNIDVNNNPVVVYGCTGTMGPVAVLMGETDASANVVMFNTSGVGGIPVGATSANTSLTISFDGHTLVLPAAVFESDGNDLSGADSIISRAFSFKGLSSKVGGVGAGPFKMS
jgi:hypothetical protein